MKAKKFLEELNAKTVKELYADLKDKKHELFNLRFQLATNQLENPMIIGEVKKQIAQINTILRQKEMTDK